MLQLTFLTSAQDGGEKEAGSLPGHGSRSEAGKRFATQRKLQDPFPVIYL